MKIFTFRLLGCRLILSSDWLTVVDPGGRGLDDCYVVTSQSQEVATAKVKVKTETFIERRFFFNISRV